MTIPWLGGLCQPPGGLWEGGTPALAEDDYFRYLGVVTTAVHKLVEEDRPRPVPACEELSTIAARLKEIEAERLRAVQAATLPEEKK